MVNVIARMKAAEAKSNFVPTFLKLDAGQKALIRPLVNMDETYGANFHRFWNPTDNRYVEAVCAKEEGLPCLYCKLSATAETDKRKNETAPKEMFFLPIYLRAILAKKVDKDTGMPELDENENPVWDYLTYMDKETQQVKQVNGIRIMQLSYKTAYKKVTDSLLKSFEKGMNIAGCDYVIERVGGDQHTTYTISAKQPAPYRGETGNLTSEASIRERILSVSPFASDEDADLSFNAKPAAPTTSNIAYDENNIAVF